MTRAMDKPMDMKLTKIRTTSRYVLPQHNDDRLARPLGLKQHRRINIESYMNSNLNKFKCNDNETKTLWLEFTTGLSPK